MSGRAARRRYFVRRRFQGRFIAAFCSLALAGAVAAAVATGFAARGALDEAMFRAHFVERTTGDILLPAILNVNGLAAVAVILLGVLAAIALFRRQSRALDDLCGRMAAWRDEAERGIAAPGTRVALPPAPGAPAQEWAAELERAYREADGALRATYRAAAEEAAQLAAAAEQLERSAGAAGDLGAAGERVGRIERALSQFRLADQA